MEVKMNQPTVAAFDFDGTITFCDTLFPFLLYTSGTLRTIKNISLVLPKLTGYSLGIISRQQVKEAVIEQFFGHMPLEEVRKLGEKFAGESLPNYIKSKSLDKLHWHQEQGHRCILISASLDIYLEPWAKKMGFQDVICSKLKVNGHGLVTGQLQGSNCWGPEKKRRLIELLGPKDGYCLYAYGDSRGDKDILNLADYPFYRKMK
jgi:HAD superfamily hydrolase (TIGR01490 family)